MITANGCIWTDLKETTDTFDKIEVKYGSGTIKPMCDDDQENGIGGCGKTTQYIVVDKKEMRSNPSKYFWMSICNVPTYELDGKYFIPARLCARCSAARDGYKCGLSQPVAKPRYLSMVRELCLTTEERATYVEVFERGFAKGQAKRSEHATKKGADRYRMKQKEEAHA